MGELIHRQVYFFLTHTAESQKEGNYENSKRSKKNHYGMICKKRQRKTVF
jgi:hypothetical protein